MGDSNFIKQIYNILHSNHLSIGLICSIIYNGGTMKIQLAIAICENYIFNHQKHSGISYRNISNAKFRSGCNLGLDNAN